MQNKLLTVNNKTKPIDYNYFNNYGGNNYSKTYLIYTTDPLSVINEFIENDINFKTLLDAGCASGELVRDFRRYDIEAFGIENNKDILKKCIVPEYCTHMDIKDMSSIKDKTFDVIYVNSLMYLFPQEILSVLKEMKRISKKAVYLCNPFLGETPESSDPYRTFLATRNWWDKQFKEAGFLKLSGNVYKSF